MGNTSKKLNENPFKKMKKYVRERLSKYETPDPKPAKMAAGLKPNIPVAEQVRRLVKQELSRQAMLDGKETWEESDDFYIVDDEFPVSEHEMLVDDENRPISQFIEETPLASDSHSKPDSDLDSKPPEEGQKPDSDSE